MNYRITIFFSLFFLVALLFSCKNNSEPDGKEPTQDSVDFTQLVKDWNSASNVQDIGKLSSLYDSMVNYYGKSQSRNSCLESKLRFFKSHPDFIQELASEITIEKINDEVKCSFTKRVSMNQKNTDYSAYLFFRNTPSGWKISNEGDNETDQHLKANEEHDTIPPEDAIAGDYNGDGKKEMMWLKAAQADEENMECIGPCNCYIHFSDPKIPPIKIENCIAGHPVNQGDLNQNGSDEIGLLPGWFSSCWRAYFVWTLVDGKWVYAVEPISTHCQQWTEKNQALLLCVIASVRIRIWLPNQNR
jgi:hypothetical protein